jgi:Zn-dependent peptidase ImmA (M78 family)/transcriptional regulator with XRE-family HTH domain
MVAPNEHKSVNPNMVILAREARGFNQSALAGKLDISQGHLSKIESGLWPADQVLDRLVNVLAYPKPFFFQTEALYGPGVSEFYHRKRQSASVAILRQAYAEINIFLTHLSRLLRAADIGECKILTAERGGNRTVEECAQAQRAMWHLPPGPIVNLVGAIESAGGIIVRWNFHTPKIDGISRWAPGLPPVFFINEEIPMDRARLTLAHELGHLVLHEAPTPEMEDEANAFAAEFLMPGREIRRQLETLNLFRLSTLKPHWKVSMAALLYRAEDLATISKGTARYLWSQLSPYKRREPPELDIPVEEPKLFADILKLHREHFQYSLDQLASLLMMLPDEVQAKYKLAPSHGTGSKPPIRLVKS